MRSQKTQKTAPHKNTQGMMYLGLEDLSRTLVMWGTAIPTKDTGPAIAVTQAESREETSSRITRKDFTGTPILAA